jgi:hypothetical protein
MGRPRKGVTDEDRFWQRVKKTRWCWLWIGYRVNGRYGAFKVGGRRVLVHRYAFKLMHGHWPKKKGLHTCDVSNCVKPDHIYDASQKQNTHDWLSRRGRKLTAKQALWCKGKSVKMIMQRYKVFWTHAYALRRGTYWKWA